MAGSDFFEINLPQSPALILWYSQLLRKSLLYLNMVVTSNFRAHIRVILMNEEIINGSSHQWREKLMNLLVVIIQVFMKLLLTQ